MDALKGLLEQLYLWGFEGKTLNGPLSGREFLSMCWQGRSFLEVLCTLNLVIESNELCGISFWVNMYRISCWSLNCYKILCCFCSNSLTLPVFWNFAPFFGKVICCLNLILTRNIYFTLSSWKLSPIDMQDLLPFRVENNNSYCYWELWLLNIL